MSKHNIAIIGATGNVGRELIRLLEESSIVKNITFIASKESAKEEIPFKGLEQEVKTLSDFDFKDIDIAVFTADATTTAENIAKVTAAGVKVIDCSIASRMNNDAALVVPELNVDKIKDAKIIASPSPAATSLALALNLINASKKVVKVTTTVMQSASCNGKYGMDELFAQSASLLGGAGAESVEQFNFPAQVAFNCIPQVGKFVDDETVEEKALPLEVNRILNTKIAITNTQVYVPTFVGVTQSVTVELENSATAADIRTLLENQAGICVIDKPSEQEYSTPYGAAETDEVYVSRIRENKDSKNTVSFWLVTDNLRKGSALNILQILENM